MPHRNDTTLQKLFSVVDAENWACPEAALQRTLDRFQRLAGSLPRQVADFLDSAHRSKRQPDGLISHDLITRTDILLHHSTQGDYECWLHVGREAITPSSTIRPHINAKGYWLATILLNGAITVQHYLYDGIGDSTWFRKEYLRRNDAVSLQPGQSFILAPGQIHRLTEVAQGTVTLTIRVIRGAQPYRDFIRQMDHVAVITREPRASRLAKLATQLREL